MKNLVEKLPDQQPALRVMAMPPDTNQYGDVFGGWIMSQVDLAGSSIASRVANSRTATVAVTSFTFKEPVWVGDVVSFYACSDEGPQAFSRSSKQKRHGALRPRGFD